MFAQFLANFLLKEKYINKRELIECLKKMKNSRVKLGVLAIDRGYLTAAQVEEIHAKQIVVDRRIGDIAVDYGYLTAAQVEELLSSQPSRYLSLCQSLIDKEYMNNSVLEEALGRFKAEYKLTEADINNPSDDKIDAVIHSFYKLDGKKSSEYMVAYIRLLMNNLVRFVGDDFVPMDVTECSALAEESISVNQRITGEFAELTSIRTDEISLLQFVSRYASEDIPVWDDYAMAAAGDFLNLHNGLFLVNMSNVSKVELKLEAPEISTPECMDESSCVCIPVLFPFGTINFVLQK